jgi:hypothetical protein
MTAPRPPADPAAHASHDVVLLAALADRTAEALTPAERRVAESNLASCPTCATIHADLVALATAAPTAAVPARPRDLRLTPAEAARLRPAAWRRWVATIGTARDGFTRPLAIGLTTFGLVGILVGTVPSILFSGSAGAALAPVGQAEATAGPAASAAAAAPAPAPGASAAAPASTEALAQETPPASVDAGGGVFAGGDEGDGAAANTPAPPAEAGNPSDAARTAIRDESAGWLVILGGVLLIAGLGLFALRWSARRLGDG